MPERELPTDGNGVTFRFALTTNDPVTGADAPATGLALVGFFASSADGTTPIDPALQVVLTEQGSTGVYVGAISGATIAAKLAAVRGARVWRVVSGPGVRVARPFRVVGARLGA